METIIIKNVFPSSDLVLKRDRFSGQWFRSRPRPVKIFDEARVRAIQENYRKRGFKVIILRDRAEQRIRELREKGRIILT
ncbi:MAG: hypothetical protein DRO95_05395 [Candidatus Altiarchaeales archaeon]|nr:MAG: hypothetical protein DRO95_05395 [Candidatus Altiarchaeales archaeon]